MTDTRTTSTSLGTTTDGSFLIYGSGDGDLFDSVVESFETDTTDEPDTTRVSTEKTTEAEFDPDAVDDKAVAEDDRGTIQFADEFASGDDDDSEDVHVDYYGDDSNNTWEGGDEVNNIYGYGGADTLSGNGGADRIFGGDGRDDLYGGNGSDYLQGGAGNDDIFGGSGHDELKGQEGHDTLYGGEGNDLLWGKSGDDTIYGGAGNDTFRDNIGHDTYTGGEGADTFDFNFISFFANQGGGHDVILDFEIGVDKIEIWNSFPEFDLSFNDYIDQFASENAEFGVLIEWQNGVILLPGVDLADLNPSNIELDYTPFF